MKTIISISEPIMNFQVLLSCCNEQQSSENLQDLTAILIGKKENKKASFSNLYSIPVITKVDCMSDLIKYEGASKGTLRTVGTDLCISITIKEMNHVSHLLISPYKIMSDS